MFPVINSRLSLSFPEIRLNHFLNQIGKARSGFPTELFPGFGRVTNQCLNFRRPEIGWINHHNRISLLWFCEELAQ